MRSYIDIINKLLENDAIDHGELLWKDFCRAIKLRPDLQMINQLKTLETFAPSATIKLETSSGSNINTAGIYLDQSHWKFEVDFEDAFANPNFAASLVKRDLNIRNFLSTQFNCKIDDLQFNSDKFYDLQMFNVGYFHSAALDRALSPLAEIHRKAIAAGLDLEETWDQIRDYLTRTYT